MTWAPHSTRMRLLAARLARPAPAVSQPSTGPPPRLFCPVSSCPDHGACLSSPSLSRVGASFHTMRPHVDAHLAGQLTGNSTRLVPTPGVQHLRSLPARSQPQVQRPLPFLLPRYGVLVLHLRHVLLAPLPDGAPGIRDVFTSRKRVRTAVRQGRATHGADASSCRKKKNQKKKGGCHQKIKQNQKSGEKIKNIRDAVRPASSDRLLHLLSEVFNLLLQGDAPGSQAKWLTPSHRIKTTPHQQGRGRPHH